MERNNTTEWFDTNRSGHDEIEDASRRFLTRLAERVGPGEPKVFRLRRDARFAKGLPPYKTGHRAGLLGEDGIVRWVDITSAGLSAAIGQPVWDRGQLGRARTALSDPDVALELSAAFEAAAAVGCRLSDPELKRPLAGLVGDHPAPQLTRHKSLVVRLAPDGDWRRPGAFDRVAEAMAGPSGVVGWLVDHVGGPS
ncbi:MAG: DUF2461 family protein [Actinomycetota bacterium]